VQAAFIAEQAAQCGYCTTGMIVAATSLLNRNRSPSDEQIRAAMSNNLCRCGTYDRIIRAVRRAAEAMKG
jgi:nicotinate dehydrogenase subunit A